MACNLPVTKITRSQGSRNQAPRRRGERFSLWKGGDEILHCWGGYKMGPPNYYKWIYPYSYTYLQPWLNRGCWGYNYLITRGAPSCIERRIYLEGTLDIQANTSWGEFGVWMVSFWGPNTELQEKVRVCRGKMGLSTTKAPLCNHRRFPSKALLKDIVEIKGSRRPWFSFRIPWLGGGNSNIFGIFIPIWGRFPFWLIFFNWVETTN